MTPTFLDSEIRTSSPFPDGQPHVAFGHFRKPLGDETQRKELRCRIVTPNDLLNVALAVETLTANGFLVDLKILYLMGARMDRRLSPREPYTLKAVCDIINSFKTNTVSVFCPHSRATRDLLDRYDEMYDWGEEIFYDVSIIKSVLGMDPAHREYADEFTDDIRSMIRASKDLSLVYPDEGASKRFAKTKLLEQYPNAELVVMKKDRNERTGEVRGIEIISGKPKKNCVFLDDLCDGGATFRHGAATLRKDQDVQNVGLVVAHGIFSKGLQISGVNYLATTNSFCERESGILLGETRGIHVLKYV